MFCTKCGKEISNEAKFCGHCGAPVLSRQPVEVPVAPVVVKEEIREAEPVIEEPVVEEPKTTEPVAEELAEVENEVQMAEEMMAEPDETTVEAVEESVAVPSEEPIAPPVPVVEPESPFAAPVSQPKEKKKISPWLWVAIGVGALLIVAIVLIIVLLGRLSDNETNKTVDEPTAQVGSFNDTEPVEPAEEEPDEEPTEDETPVFTDFPPLSYYYDDFIESDTFDDSTPLGEGEILYMGEAYYDNIGQCYVSFVLSKDRKSLKNFIVYMMDLSLVVEGNGRSYDLSSITSIRNNYNSLIDYTEDYCEITLGESSLHDFVLDTVNYEYAFGTLDFLFKYYPPMSAGSASSPVTVELGASDVYFDPVRIG